MQATDETTFTVSIELGNAAMRTGEDVAEALESVARQMRDRVGDRPPERLDRGRVRDSNGDTVGTVIVV